MEEIKQALAQYGFKGDVDDAPATLDAYSHDASMFEIKPKLVIAPKSGKDVEAAVKVVAERKAHDAHLSLTARSAGTDMSGAAINDSVIVDFNRHLNKFISHDDDRATTQPGMFFETSTKRQAIGCSPPIPLAEIFVRSVAWSTTTRAVKNRWNSVKPTNTCLA